MVWEFIIIIGLTIEATIQRAKTLALIKNDLSTRKLEIVFLLCGFLVVFSFYPHNLFDFFSFGPRLNLLGQVWTVLLLTRTANGVHTGWKKTAEYFDVKIKKEKDFY